MGAHGSAAGHVYIFQDAPLLLLPSLDRFTIRSRALRLLSHGHCGYIQQIIRNLLTISAYSKVVTETPGDVIRRRVAWRRGQRTAVVELMHEAQQGSGQGGLARARRALYEGDVLSKDR